jgi:Bacterial regulatory proteins, crp family
MSRQDIADYLGLTIETVSRMLTQLGVVTAGHQREAAAVVAENTSGAKKMINHIAWIEPTSGVVLYSPEDQEPKSAA